MIYLKITANASGSVVSAVNIGQMKNPRLTFMNKVMPFPTDGRVNYLIMSLTY